MPFASPNERAIHFAKHGHKFGARSDIEYERLADAFMSGAMDADTWECVRPGRVNRVRFRTTNRHLGIACIHPAFIRTFYPVSAGHVAHYGGSAKYFAYECGRAIV